MSCKRQNEGLYRALFDTYLAFGGTGLGSYRVRGVDGSCAKHLTVESYMVIYAANSYTYYYYY